MAQNRETYVHVEDVGWVKKQTKEKRNFSEDELESWALLISYWRWYPDALCDLLRSEDADYANEEIVQRVMMRAFARYRHVDITGCRGLTKTSTKMKQKLVFNLVWPNTKSSYYGPSYTQMAKIARDAFEQVQHDYPALAAHYEAEQKSKMAFLLTTPYGSSFTITSMRGGNFHDCTAEEYAQEEDPPFDYEAYSAVLNFAIRLTHRVGKQKDPTYVTYQKHTITSAGRKQNDAFITRCKHRREMEEGMSAFIADIPWEVVVLQQIRDMDWVEEKRRDSDSDDKWLREMGSIYTGASEDALISDSVLYESTSLMQMEARHCGDPNAIYIIGYDVSYSNAKGNAKCAAVVVKCLKQKDFFKRDRFKKQVVYIDDNPPPPQSMHQAQKIKKLWDNFSMDGGAGTYIAIDNWQYGKAVTECLMMDLQDGLPPLCIRKHADYTNVELPGALPVIYPIRAGGVGVTDPDSVMIRYAQTQFAQNNVELLTHNVSEGVEAYKLAHRIKDDYEDARVSMPYKKTKALIGQIQNLKGVATSSGISERRISQHIQRDSWSALKYALRLAQILESEMLADRHREKSDWTEELAAFRNAEQETALGPVRSRGIGRVGGRRFG